MGRWEFALPNFSNVKDGLAMGSRKLTAEDLKQITKLAKSWGKMVVRQAFGDGGPGLDVDLSQMEDVAAAAASGLVARPGRASGTRTSANPGDQRAHRVGGPHREPRRASAAGRAVVRRGGPARSTGAGHRSASSAMDEVMAKGFGRYYENLSFETRPPSGGAGEDKWFTRRRGGAETRRRCATISASPRLRVN